MAKQIITLEVDVDPHVIDEIGQPKTWDWENATDRWMEDDTGYVTNSVKVINASPVRYTVEEETSPE